MRNRMLISYLLSAVVSLLTAYLASYLFVQFKIVENVRINQIEETKAFQSFFKEFYQSTGSWEGVGQVDIQKLLNEAVPEQYFHDGLTLVDLDGEILLTENKAQYGSVVDRSTLEFGAPVVVGEKEVGYLYSSSLNDLLFPLIDGDVLKPTGLVAHGSAVIGLLVAIVMSTIMTRTLLRPIQATIEASKRIAEGELNLRVSLEPYRDMAELGEAVNDMAAELEKNQRIQKYMLMDIAHDLRTPLSVQKATLEAFEDKVYPFDEEGIDLLKMQNNQLIHLVEDLRLLTLSDAGIFTARKEQVEMQAFVQGILNCFESVFAKKNLKVIFSQNEDDYLIHIDPHLMQRVFENLFQNAYQHSPEGGEIRVRILRMINRMEIIITDQGSGIPENKQETIFDRYYRMRPPGDGEFEGLGLGLTISRRIVEAHGGSLIARNSPKNGAEFVLGLPYSAR